jgi:hypothetical protein
MQILSSHPAIDHIDRPGPPSTTKILAPGDPQAAELARLWDALRACHEPYTEAEWDIHQHGILLDDDDTSPIPDSPEWVAYWEERKRLNAIEEPHGERLRLATIALESAIVEVHDESNGESPTFNEWHRVGTCHRIIGVANRIYALRPCESAEWPSQVGDEGVVDIVVIDL